MPKPTVGGRPAEADPRHWSRNLRWRTGRKVGRTLYAMTSDEPSDNDVLIGVVDHWLIADQIVADHNAHIDGSRDAQAT